METTHFHVAMSIKVKQGIKCSSQKEVANAYTYMKNITQKHPFMLGWWHCGYIEQWAPAGSHLGQQCGFTLWRTSD